MTDLSISTLANDSADQRDVGVPRRIRSILAGSLGNLVEWYDWYVYAAFSLYFAKSFFPAGDDTSQLLNTAAIFAVGFLMRPVGGWLMGIFADRCGRRTALTLSILLMCFGSLMIAVLPGYGILGDMAPALLLVARLIQGLSIGGEYGASATYLSEVASDDHRGFYSSFQYVTLIMGQLLALAVLLLLQYVILTPAQLDAWGWRIPFAIGALFALATMWLRRNMDESEAFLIEKDQGSSSKGTLRALMQHPREIATVIGLTLGGTIAFYTYTVYMQKFLVNTVGLSKNESTLISAATLFIFMGLQPLFGLLSDRIGRRPLLIGFGVLGTFGTVPILTSLSAAKDAWTAFALIMGALIIVSGYTAINAVVKAELFPTRVRALGVALPYALTVSIFGGTAEYLALWFKSIGHEPYFYWYVTACILCSLLVYLFMRDTRLPSLIERPK
jgi:MFS transporter, MHS family, alpha-ketoglutarate permease